MSILIKGMEMPKSCRKCYLCDFDTNGYYCIKLEKVLDKWHVRTQRDYDCPLVEVPTPHGNLIDRNAPHLIDALKGIREVETQIYGRDSWGFANKSMSVIYDAPTIIEAEGSDNG